MNTCPNPVVAIIGAGPAGLTAGLELSRRGKPVVIFEQDPRYVGGLSRTVEYKGFRFDIGGHRFFSKNDEIERLWEDICGEDLITRPRLSRIYYRGKYFDYPLKPANSLLGLGIFESIRCIVSFFLAKVIPIQPEKSFEDWVVNRFGRRLFEIFFKTYTEKVWGHSCKVISADWASQRIKGLSLLAAVINSLRPSGNRSRGEVIKTLIDSFRYPRLGPGMMWEKAQQKIAKHGGVVRLGQRVASIYHDGHAVTHIEIRSVEEAAERIEVEHLISSMPMRSLIRNWNPPPPESVREAAENLKYRDFLTVALIIRRPDPFPDNWIYVHDSTVRLGRVQNFRSWSPDMVPDPQRCALGLEYFCFENDELWNTADSALLQLGADELGRMGLIAPNEVEDGYVVRVPKAYPVYDDTYSANVYRIRDYLAHFSNIQLVGRNGMHKYNNQDHAMMTGLLAARNLIGESYDVWKVNTDAEYHEEVREPRPASGRLVPSTLPDRNLSGKS